MSFWDEKEAKRLFKELPFYSALIEKPYIKCLNNIDMLRDFSFYDEGYTRSYSTEILDSKDSSVQLKISKPSIKDLFKDLLNEITGFKYQITLKSVVKQMQRKYRHNFLWFVLILLLRQ